MPHSAGVATGGRSLLGPASLALALAVGGCGDVRDTARNEFQPVTPGTLAVAAEVPVAGFWQGDDGEATGGFEYG
ncbi:MAG: hypothetical protein ACR2HQ_02160 [Ilumatobacteraceae bacterium]